MKKAPVSALSHRRLSRWTAIVAVYGAAVVLGYLAGGSMLRSSSSAPPSPARTALARARVGWVLRQPDAPAPPAARADLQAEIAIAQQSWPPSLRGLFELVAAVQGLSTGGQPDWARAQSRCQALKWSQCDRAALEQLRARGRP